MNLYDGKSKKLGININIFDSKTKVLGYDLPNDINIELSYNISSEYGLLLVNSIKDWLSEYAGDRNIIPFISHTDHHGRLSYNASKGIFKLISDIINFDEISSCINLGDNVTDHWEEDNTNQNVWLRNNQLEQVSETLNVIPKNKQINIFGNHDTWKFDNNEIFDIMELKYLQPYFNNSYRKIKIADNSGNFVIYDDNFKVKYLVIASWDRSNEYSRYRYLQYRINTKHWKWIINQLKENDGYDIIVLSHVPLYLDHSIAKDPITNESSSHSGIMSVDDWNEGSFKNLFVSRKNKTSGTFIDGEGFTHNYDFSNCSSNLLCAIAGHTHYDEYNYIENSLLSLAYDWFDAQTLFFSLIDRNENKLKVWKMSNDNNVPNVETYSLDLN